MGLLREPLDMIRRNGGVIVIDVSNFKFGDSFRAMLRQIIGEARTAMYHMILNELFARCTAITTPTENLADQMRGVLRRSEEHTSELQSLMRISSAVFCLKNTIKTP